MAFAQSFLAGATLATKEQDRKQQLLTALLGRRPAGGGISVAGGGSVGGDPLSRIRKIEREREDEEARAQLLAQQTQLNEALIRQQQAEAEEAERRVAPLSDEEYQAKLDAEAETAYQKYAQTIREMPFAQAEELEGRRRVEAGIRGVENEQREAARRQHMDCYANRDVECLKRTWRNMFPGAQFGADFKMGPQGMPMIKYPGEDEWDLYDQGAFRQAAVYAANTQLEQPVAGGQQAMPGVSAMVGQDIQQGFVAPAETPAQAGMRAAAPGVSPGAAAAPAAGMKAPTWKQYQDVVTAIQAGKIDAYKAVHDIASERNPMTDAMGMPLTGEALEKAKKGYETDFTALMTQLGQNRNLRQMGVGSPTAGLTRREENTAIAQANEQWNKYQVRDGKRYRMITNPDGSQREEEVTPQAYWDMLWGQVSPRVAAGWAKKNAKDFLEPGVAPPALERGREPIEELKARYGVVQTGQYEPIYEDVGMGPVRPGEEMPTQRQMRPGVVGQGLVTRPAATLTPEYRGQPVERVQPAPTPAQPAPGMEVPPGQIMERQEPQRFAQQAQQFRAQAEAQGLQPMMMPPAMSDVNIAMGYDANNNPVPQMYNPQTGRYEPPTAADVGELQNRANQAQGQEKAFINSLLASIGRYIRRQRMLAQIREGTPAGM